MSRRVSREDWCRAGLSILGDEGERALTLERLTVTVGRTKGSFYHHFADMDTYLAAVLELWEQQLTERLIERSSVAHDARARQAMLGNLVRELDHACDRAVRAWAQHDPRAGDAMRRVDERRVAYLTELHRARGHRRPDVLATLEYAAFVGAQHLDLFTDAKRAILLESALGEALDALGRPEAPKSKR